jgi:hypothetical protein
LQDLVLYGLASSLVLVLLFVFYRANDIHHAVSPAHAHRRLDIRLQENSCKWYRLVNVEEEEVQAH